MCKVLTESSKASWLRLTIPTQEARTEDAFALFYGFDKGTIVLVDRFILAEHILLDAIDVPAYSYA